MEFGVSEAKQMELQRRMEGGGLREEDLQEEFVRSGGPGGQNVNKTATCVVLTHEPTKLKVKMQKDRQQGMNRFYARRRMCELLEAKLLGKDSPLEQEREKIRRQKQRRRRRSRKKKEE